MTTPTVYAPLLLFYFAPTVMHQLVVEQTFSPFNRLPQQMLQISWVKPQARQHPVTPGTRAVVTNNALEYIVLDNAWRYPCGSLTLPKSALDGTADAVRACAQQGRPVDVYTHIDGHAWVAQDMHIWDETADTFHLSVWPSLNKS